MSNESWAEEAQRIVGGGRAQDYSEAGAEVTPRQFCAMMVPPKAVRDKHHPGRDCGADGIGYLILAERHER